MRYEELAEGDREAVDNFTRFLSWGVQPRRPGQPPMPRPPVPPAWWAFVLGATEYCPPPGVL